jgi:pyruvate/2-oxoglutarate dehydrogenase complex dihydrolipoamide acyltransferase (E2) component
VAGASRFGDARDLASEVDEIALVRVVAVRHVQTVAARDGDAVVAAPTLPVSLSADHRVIDGHDATNFVEQVLARLRDPSSLAPI